MSSITYSHDTRLSDSLEREVMRKAVSEGQSLSLVALCKTGVAAVGRGISHVVDYVFDVTEALNDARAKDANFSRSFW
jgi:hypothetical protein